MTDTTKLYVNTTDGKWYYYDNEWKIGGNYQSIGISDKSINIEKTDFIERINLADTQNGIDGKSNSHNINADFGAYTDNENYYASSLIPISENEKLIAQGKYGSRYFLYITFYNSSKKVIQSNERI